MADKNGLTPGQPGYDPSSDSGNSDNGDGTFTDNQGNVMDASGGLLSAGPGATQNNSAPSAAPTTNTPSPVDTSGGQTNFQSQQLTNPFAGQVGQNSTAAMNAAGYADTPEGRAQQAAGQPPSGAGAATTQQSHQGAQVSGQTNLGGIESMLQQLLQGAKMSDAQFQAALQAATAANAQDFAEKVREFNANHDIATQQLGISQAGVTGTYNGQPTLAAAVEQASLTGWYTPPNSTLTGNATTTPGNPGSGAGTGGSPGGASPLSQYTPGTVVRTASNQFGVVGQNGALQLGGDHGPIDQAIYNAIQNNGGIVTVPDAAFSASQASPPTPTAGASQQSGPPTSTPIQTLAGAKQQADLSGVYNGQPTEAARQFNVNTATDLTKLGASLSGPADYFKFLNAANGGRNIMASLGGNQPKPAFGGFSGTPQPLTLQSIMDRFGISSGQPAQSANLPASSSVGSETGKGTTQGGSDWIQLPNGMGSIPTPQSVNPAVWDSWGSTGQAFIKSAAGAAGYDPTMYEQQVNATRPGGATFSPQSTSSYAGTGGGGQSAF